MKIAVTVWEDRVSPVFDSSRKLLIADIVNEQVIGRLLRPFNPEPVSRLGDLLCTLQIEVLICGAISQPPSDIIESSGVKLISFIGGKTNDILETFSKGGPIVPEFLMPGCGRQNRGRRRRHNLFLSETMEVINMPKRDGTGPTGQGGGKGKGGCKPGQGGQGGRRGKGSGQGCGQSKGKGQNQGGRQDKDQSSS